MILIIQGVSSPMQRDVDFGAHACARKHGWIATAEEAGVLHGVGISDGRGLVDRTSEQAGIAIQMTERLIREWRPHAVLVTFAFPELVARAAALAPTVAAMTYTDGVSVPSIDVDQNAVVRPAVEHLIALGLRQFAAIGEWSLPWIRERANCFANQLRDADFACRIAGPELSLPVSSGFPRDDVARWLAALPKPVGILACSDRAGLRLAHLCRSANIRVPEDAAIIGIDNDDIACKMACTPLSSVAINWRQIGYDAAEKAGRLAEGKPVEPGRTLVGPAGVVVRRSSDLVAVDDPEVAAALRIIREHADRTLTVSQLLRQIPIDRNRLERRFREVVGRRILQEVNRVHVEQAKRLLASSELPMPDVALQSGFTYATTFSSVFRQQTGYTPSEYRRKFRLADPAPSAPPPAV